MTTSMSILNAIPQLDMTLHADLTREDARPLGQP